MPGERYERGQSLEKAGDRLAEYVVGQESERIILSTLGLDPRKPETQALMAAARHYGLDPLVGPEILLIPNRGKMTVYVTRDGMLAIAHRHPQFDGMRTDEERRNSTGDGWTAYVEVFRKDMAHGFRYGAQCKDTERQAKEGYGPEQALARAERRALRRAFHLVGDGFAEVRNVVDVGSEITRVEPITEEPMPNDLAPGDGMLAAADHPDTYGIEPDPELTSSAAVAAEVAENYGPLSNDLARRAVASTSADTRAAFMERWGIADFREPWPPEAIRAALEAPF